MLRKAHPDLSQKRPKVFEPVPGYDLVPDVRKHQLQTRSTFDELWKENKDPQRTFRFQKMRV